ncbi:MAG TPA: glycoside hydrolase family 15 protein [Thermoanaerobaculia bacterium]|nr:glycoside hydrolase family 15 protein [Thermoanaerobaculia bacterium]
MVSLDLGIVGNCTISALIDRQGTIVWSCFPRFDGDPLFCRLLDNDSERGFYGVELDDLVEVEQRYLENTAVLVTRLIDRGGDGVEITDFAPRFMQFGRIFRPTILMRIVRPFGETPRIRLRVRPMFHYGAHQPEITRGSNHIRYVAPDASIRLTTNAPLTYLLDETPFILEDEIVSMLGPDESLRAPVIETAHEFLEQTVAYWRALTMRLSVPFEWQTPVIRAAITLKLCSFEETGAIVAAMTTSIPEIDGQGRNWDYRFCWLRDAYFVVRTLNRLGYIETMEDFLAYISNIVVSSKEGYLQPVYGIGLEARLTEREVPDLRGYRHNRPVRVGNQAYEHDQHDSYGSVVLAIAQAFFDQRLRRPVGQHTFHRLEAIGDQAFARYDQPDAGLWEFRTRSRIHTHSSVMCWAACDRLARIAGHLNLAERSTHWQTRADQMRETILREAWNPRLNSFTAGFNDDDIDASLLLMHEVGFIRPDDPRFVGTVAAVERELRRGQHLFRYVRPDDFGQPENAFVVCTFWYIDALIAQGRTVEARELFENMLACRNHLGLLSEDIDPETNELWGNFPQTYPLVGIVNCAMKLSKTWEEVV